ncbi:MAG: hypothetical protein AB1705_13360 [Verrucomicrobiota bacterium]
MRTIIPSLLIAGLVATGCGAKTESPPASATPAKPIAITAPAEGQVAPPAPPDAPTDPNAASATPAAPSDNPEGLTPEPFNTAAHSLDQIVQQYIQDQRRNPKSFDEVVKAGYLPIVPVAPKGKKYVIDQKTFHVVEVNHSPEP